MRLRRKSNNTHAYLQHDYKAEHKAFKLRALQAFIFVVLLIGILIGNLYYLQVISFKDYNMRSNDNRIRLTPVASNRGLIYDRNGVVLANNVNSFFLNIIPEQVKNIEETLEQLQQFVNISQEEIDKFKDSLKSHSKFKPLLLKANLTEQEVADFSVNQHIFPGAEVKAGLTRSYPYGALLTHVIGYIGKINDKEQELLKEDPDIWKNYLGTTNIGKLGIEKYYESKLHGTVGYQEEEVNNRGRVINILNKHPPIAGESLYLTIDLKLQQKAMDLLKDNRGVIIAMDPNNGEILAMASNPSYDPNSFVQGISSKQYKSLLDDESKPLINRATKGVYPPASTVKPFLGLLGIDHEVIDKDTKIYDPGYWQIPNVERKYRDWKRWGHGWVDLTSSLIESCDVYFYNLAYKLGISNIHDFMVQFGFGVKTNIDIKEESSAVMPSIAWKKKRYKQPWYIGDTISVGIGQGYWSATPLQLAHAVTILANHGKDYTPHLLRSYDNKNVIKRKMVKKITLKNEDNWGVIGEAMYKTAAKSLFKGSPYKVAMKTGTAQVVNVKEDQRYDPSKIAEHLRDNALIVAYAPYQNPKVVIAIILENAGWGGQHAGPIAKEFLDFYMQQEQWSIE